MYKLQNGNVVVFNDWGGGWDVQRWVVIERHAVWFGMLQGRFLSLGKMLGKLSTYVNFCWGKVHMKISH